MEVPAIFTEAEFYQQNFDPQEYLKEFYSMSSSREGARAFMMQNLRILHKMFSSVSSSEAPRGVGWHRFQAAQHGASCGRHTHAPALLRTPLCLHTDWNCWELEKWLKNKAGAFNWEPVVKYFYELEGYREKWAKKQEKLRKKVKQVLKCDVTKAKPMGPMSPPPADCIISMLCLEGACKELATFCSALRNISTLLKPGGHLVTVTALEDTYYTSNKQAFSCLCLQKQEVEEAMVAAGFEQTKHSKQTPQVNKSPSLFYS
uniref:Uncharacterized protein n=1 Tax=Zosterops lateralis melanops TaxID=1220523 RepID=A0A8D2PIB1_ZOSLA